MTKKKKEKIKDGEGKDFVPKSVKKDIKREAKRFKPTEWAIQKGFDASLFLYWENQKMDEQEFDKLNEKIRGE